MTQRTCAIEGCEKPPASRGWCHAHYYRWRVHGDPHRGGPIMGMYKTPEEAFAARTTRQGDCLIWTGADNGNGYGVLQVTRRLTYAHRYAWERANGTIPEGAEIDHICWNKKCVEPTHLRLANRSGNGANMPGRRRTRKVDLPRNVRKIKGRYYVTVMKYRKSHNRGGYETPEEAAIAAAELRQELFGDYAGKG